MGRINWAQIEADYVTGIYKDGDVTKHHTCKTLARKYGVSLVSVEKRCADYKWASKREKYLADIGDRIAEKKKDQIVERAVRFDQDLFTLADMIKQIIFAKMIVEGKDGSRTVNKNVSVLDLQRYANIGNQIQMIREKAIGVSGSADESSLQELNSILKQLQEDGDPLPEADDLPVEETA